MTNLSYRIKERFQLGDVYHMTDFANFESIITHEMLISKKTVDSTGISFKDISNQGVQRRRANVQVSNSGDHLHDYVPLYWGRKTPMVAEKQSMNDGLIFLVFSTNLLNDLECVISNGNASTSRTKFWKYQSIDSLEGLDSKSINTIRYAHDKEIKRRKQSELLVKNELPLKYLLRVVCRTNEVKSKLEAILATHGVRVGVYIGYHNYYYL